MSGITLLSEADLRACVALDVSVIDAIEQAFVLLATADVAMPPILRLDIAQHNGEVDVKTAYLPGLERFAIKVSPGFFDNPTLGLPSLNGMMMLLSARTGLLDALLLDNGYLTAVRTAAAGAVAARALSRVDSCCVALIGAGEQAALQLQALRLVRPIESVRVWTRDIAKAEDFSAGLARTTGLTVSACASIEEAIADADIAVTCTPSREPLIEARHLHPGLHITAMGSDAEHKNEISPQALARVDRYVADRLSQTRILGELHHALVAGAITDESGLTELGQILAGQHPGRTDASQITLCDLTGTGAQDTAMANLAFERARSAGKGFQFGS
ncbi:ectoine utilization protein EutC [Pseudomonas sp. 14P_8.1_Bac3]|uniref:ectoine utilization protein EutC n=1 Tax=Pseudomonas sp. 14P_8.1_Bac3 TaxID=2971621 RepID=UPI0021C78422|nr:ectoine utilization protein EutC [Pseudomonas sp. 14P_8.1_Bac3]MCU1760468.1 ectoine utilization protein EutC [Pseudomonas sp. 14P_8.1_Bac3]